jgi:plasmid maintenance system killer protein
MIRSFKHKGVERFFKSWRLTFAFESGEAVLVDYQDDH